MITVSKSHIPIFVLANAYNKKNNREKVTPHKIAVAIFIREFTAMKIKDPDGLAFGLRAKHKKDFCMLVLKLVQSPDLDLSELQAMLHSDQYNLLATQVRTFESKLVELDKGGVVAMLDLFSNIKNHLKEPLPLNPAVTKTSIIGMFLRRIYVFFEKQTFSEVVALCEAFRKYLKDWDARCTCTKTSATGDDSLESSNDMELTIGEEIKHPLTESPASSRVKGGREEESHSKCTEKMFWSKKQAELFVSQQAALIQNNEPAAMPPLELHEKLQSVLQANSENASAHFLSYLNCLRVKEYSGAIDSLYHSWDRNTYLLDVNRSPAATNEDKCRSFRYASLNVAILHVLFGHKKQAIRSLKEAIMMAHEGNDNHCLQHALAWLYKLSIENKEILMERSISKSTELSLSYLASLGIQSMAQHAAAMRGPPALVFELMSRSDQLNFQHSMVELMANSYSQKAALWSLYGKTQMCSVSSQLLLHLNTAMLAYGSPVYNGEACCQAVCNVANILTEQGDYEHAATVLQHARERFPHEPLSHWWMFSEQVLNFTRAIHHGKWQDAEQAITKMAAINKWESQLRKAELYLSKGDYSAAVSVSNAVLDHFRIQVQADCSSTSLQVRALVLCAELQCGSAPSAAIALLTTALSTAQYHHMDHLAALVGLHIANLQLQIGLPSQALGLIEEFLLVILSNGGAFDQGRALLLLGKCKIAALSGLLKGCDVTEALLYNEIGNVIARKKCALEFRQLDEQHPTKIATTLFTHLEPTTRMAIYFSSGLEDTILIFSSVCLFLYWYFTSTYDFWEKKGIRNPVLLLRDPDLIRQVLIKDFNSFQDRNFPVNEKTDPLSCHLFALRGEKWRKLRVCASELSAYLECSAVKGSTMEFREVAAKYTTDVIGTCAFGLQFNSLSDENSEFRIMGRRVFKFSLLEAIPRAFCFFFPRVAETLGISFIPKDVTKFFLRVVKDVVGYREKNGIVRKDFLQLLIELKGKRNVNNENSGINPSENHSNDHKDLKTDDNIELTDSLLAAQCFVFFVAGFETSSTTIGFALYELAVNPEIQDRASSEVVSVLQGNGGEMTFEAVNKMEYLGRVLDDKGTSLCVSSQGVRCYGYTVLTETLRKYPVVPVLSRNCTKPCTIQGTDLLVVKGMKVLIPVVGLHMDPEYYPDPLKFDPERFSEKNQKARPHFTYLPFGEGPRICIGMRFGLLQSKLGLATLLSKYKFTPCEDTSIPLKMDRRAIFASPEGGIPLRIQQRN
uniref:Anaphase-promoting complex subunit 5 n=1 Tax=Timema tahoe TaxID=61484 RepID=A0A7R9NX00_9NEOP|nr:unnamed protein product [Timema tahoe]